MKKTLTIFIIFLAGIISCHAQDTKTASPTDSTKKSGLPYPWDSMLDMSCNMKTLFTVEAEYQPLKHNVVFDEITQKKDLNTAVLGFIVDSPVSRTIPIYMDYGLKVKYSGNKYNMGTAKDGSLNWNRYHYLTLTVPVSAMFYTGVASTPLAFAGFFGFDANVYALAQKQIYKDGNQRTINFIDDEPGYHRFTLDWHIGCRIYCYKAFFGIGFEGPVTKFRETNDTKEDFFGLTLTLGTTF